MDTLSNITIRRADPLEPGVRDVLERHFALMRAGSPEESCHVMTPDALVAADTHLLAAIDTDGAVLGVGGFQTIAPQHAELKSMHIVQEARGKGVGKHLLDALITAAKDHAISKLSLETGTADAFTAARHLYAAHGFHECPPFGSYSIDPLSVFMERTI